MSPEIQLLSKPDRAKRIDARDHRLAAAQQRQARASAADFRQERPGPLQCWMLLERMPDGEIDEAAFFGFVDSLKGDTRASAHAIEKQLSIPCFAYGACRDRTYVPDAVLLEELTESFNRRERCIRGLRADDSARKRVTPEDDAARGFLDDANGLPWQDFSDDEPDGARPHVEDGHESGNHRYVRVRDHRRNRHSAGQRCSLDERGPTMPSIPLRRPLRMRHTYDVYQAVQACAGRDPRTRSRWRVRFT